MMRGALLVLLFTAAGAVAQTTLPDGKLGFWNDEIVVPVGPEVNETTVRTVSLIVDVYARAADVSSKVRLIRDLGSTRLPEGVEALKKMSGDTDVTIRMEVARSLGVCGQSAGVGVLKAMLNDNEAQVRREVILAGAALNDASFASVGLSDADAGVLMASIRSVSGAVDAEALSVRLPRFKPDQQVEAIRSIGRLGSDRPHADSIVGFLDGNVAQRSVAVEALGRLRATRFADRAVKLIQDVHPTVRRAATSALLGLEDEAARRQHALVALSDPDATVRTAAALVLVTTPDVSVVAPLTARLTDRYAPLHEAARTALLASAKFPDSARATIDAAVTLLGDPVAERRADGSWLLGESASDAGLDAHVALLNDTSIVVVAQAALSLGQVGKPEAGDALVALVRKLNKPVQQGVDPDWQPALTNAIVSAGLLGRADVLALVESLIPNNLAAPAPRAAAVWVAGYSGAQDVVPKLFRILNDRLEIGAVQTESIKALGNLRSPAAKKLLDDESNLALWQGDPVNAYLIHWASDRVNGTTTPFTPRPRTFRADTSVREVSGN